MSRELSARFAEAGGTIGRGDSNTLVLPDPERYISRIHATVSFQAGGFIITDNGTKNPLVVNGRQLGAGKQAKLSNGDQLKLGGYALEVMLAPAQVPKAPAAHVDVAGSGRKPKDDPLAVLAGPGAKAGDPFADLLIPATPAPPRPEPAIPASPAAAPFGGAIPPDALGDIRGKEPSVDEMFGLRTAQPDRMAPPLPSDRLGAQGHDVVDPFQALGAPAKPIPPPAIPDNVLELLTPYKPPVAKPDPALGPRVDAAPAPPVAPRVSAPPVTPVPPPPPVPPVRQPLPARSAPLAPPGMHEPSSARGDAALMQAFLQGLGIPDAKLPKGLTPDMMETLGKLLREAVQGTLDLLRARNLTKSEMRADVTMIRAMDNNPLKFSPSAEAALGHLLGPQGQGFLSPVHAMRDAYDDLRAHQLGVLAGMRAALDEVLKRFVPEELEERLSDPSMLDSLLPMNRRAKLWDLFVDRYGEVADAARENFNAAFGKAFIRAYEAQIARLRGEGRGGGASGPA
jgi:type VI secretion system FHA domain protein